MTLDQHAEWSLQMLEAVGFVICVLNEVCCKSLLIIHTTSVNYKQNDFNLQTANYDTFLNPLVHVQLEVMCTVLHNSVYINYNSANS